MQTTSGLTVALSSLLPWPRPDRWLWGAYKLSLRLRQFKLRDSNAIWGSFFKDGFSRKRDRKWAFSKLPPKRALGSAAMRRGTEQMRTNCLFLRRSIFGCQAISGLSVEEPAKEMAHHQLLGAAPPPPARCHRQERQEMARREMSTFL